MRSRMPHHPKRPRDPAQLAKMIVDIATGDIPEELPRELTPAAEFAKNGGLKGGKARAKSLSPDRRRKIAREASEKRWSKFRK
jgi:hypothetical protein